MCSHSKATGEAKIQPFSEKFTKISHCFSFLTHEEGQKLRISAKYFYLLTLNSRQPQKSEAFGEIFYNFLPLTYKPWESRKRKDFEFFSSTLNSQETHKFKEFI